MTHRCGVATIVSARAWEEALAGAISASARVRLVGRLATPLQLVRSLPHIDVIVLGAATPWMEAWIPALMTVPQEQVQRRQLPIQRRQRIEHGEHADRTRNQHVDAPRRTRVVRNRAALGLVAQCERGDESFAQRKHDVPSRSTAVQS